MLFPPEMVETYGREWLLNLPADRVEELDDGAVMIVTTDAIPKYDSDIDISELVNDSVKPIETAFDQRSSE